MMNDMNIKPRQLEILEAAGHLLNEEGVSGLTVKKLAERVGFTESALYRHYNGKEAVLLALLDYLYASMNHYLSPNAKLPPEQQLRQWLGAHLYFLAAHPYFLTAVFSEGLLRYSARMREKQLRLMALMEASVAATVEQGQQEGVFISTIPAAELTHTVMGSFRLLMLRWLISGFEFDVVQAGQTHINYLTILLAKK